VEVVRVNDYVAGLHVTGIDYLGDALATKATPPEFWIPAALKKIPIFLSEPVDG